MSNHNKGLIILWIISLLVVFSLGMFIEDCRMKDYIEYRYIYYTNEKTFCNETEVKYDDDLSIESSTNDILIRIEIMPNENTEVKWDLGNE